MSKSSSLAPPQRRARILIVEDEAVVALDLESELTEMGYEVCGCIDNGRDAIAEAAARRPDLVLMDIVIKGDIDGIEAAGKIAHAGRIPVVFLTAYSDDATVARAALTAPYGYLTKPFQARELHAVIEVALYKATLERCLRDSEQWFAATLRGVADGVVATDRDGLVHFINPAAEEMLGWSNEEAKGHPVQDVIRLDDTEPGVHLPPTQRALLEDTVVGVEWGSRLVTRSGTRLPIDDSAAPIRDQDGNVLGAVMVFRDVRQRLEAEQRLRQSEARFRATFDFAPVGMALVGLDNRLLQVNDALARMLGYPIDQILGAELAHFAHAEDAHLEVEMLHELLARRSSTVQFEKRLISKEGKEIWTLSSVTLLYENDAPLCYLFQIHDVSGRKLAEFRLAHMAHFDPLTGLANRVRLNEALTQAIVGARRHHQHVAVIFIDLDYFKQVNDTLGHAAGDQLLEVIARRLMAAVRESDCVGRLGGDEFAIILPELQNIEDLLVVTNKVQTECGKPISLEGGEVHIGLSIGVSLFPDDAQDPPTLLRNADTALYHAKSEGRNHLQFYRPELTEKMQARMSMISALRVALERDEFELYYQPIMSLADGQPHGAEALLRWHHPEQGLLTPDAFIALAEEAGLSVPIGQWVMASACEQAALWKKDGLDLSMSINVSASQFKNGKLHERLADLLNKHGLEAKQLCIEITEQSMLDDSEASATIIRGLKTLGVRVSVDDFGTGYSSLSCIGRLAPDELKLDRSLIDNADQDDTHQAILRAALAMARSLRLMVVSEGLERIQQESLVREMGCEYAQGFLYARPASASAFASWAESKKAR